MESDNEAMRTKAWALLGVCLLAFSPARANAAGEILWFNLLSEDVTKATRFYSELFGWEIEPGPAGGFMGMRDGMPFAGFRQIEDRLPNVSESMWLAAISVADLRASSDTARRLGATLRNDAEEVPGWGRYTLLQDPQGAPVLLVAPTRSIGGREGYGGWRWAELWTHDAAAAADFYRQVVGYDIETVTVEEQPYAVFRSSGGRSGGLVALDNPEIAARWAPYVGVTDLRGTLVRVWGAGGKVLREPAEIDFAAAGRDRVALISDPSGAALFLYQLEESAAVDPVVAREAERGGTERRSSAVDSGVRADIAITYGFGAGWVDLYPDFPFRPFGPRL